MMKFTSLYPHSHQIYSVDSFPMVFVESHPLFFTSKSSFFTSYSTKTPQPSHLPPPPPTPNGPWTSEGRASKKPEPCKYSNRSTGTYWLFRCGHGRSIPLFEHTPGIPKNFPQMIQAFRNIDCLVGRRLGLSKWVCWKIPKLKVCAVCYHQLNKDSMIIPLFIEVLTIPRGFSLGCLKSSTQYGL